MKLASFREFIGHFGYFYGYLGHRIPLFLFLGIVVAFLDGFGLAMFLPMLNIIAESYTTGVNSTPLKLEVFGFDLTASGDGFSLTAVLLTMLGFFTLKGVVRFLETLVAAENQEQFVVKLREQNIMGLVHFRFDLFSKADAGQIQNAMSGEVYRVAGAFRSYMALLQQFFMVLVYTTLAFLMNTQFAVFVLIGAALTNVLFNKLQVLTKALSRKITVGNEGYHGLLIQQVAFFKYLKATGQLGSYAQKLITKIREIEEAHKKIGVIGGGLYGSREPILILILVIAILVQVNLFGTNLALILISILFFYRALTSVTQLQLSHNQFVTNEVSLQSLQEFNQRLKEGAERTADVRLDGLKRSIELRDVSFAYNAQGDVLSNISLTIAKNESIAFVGESGAGKTTLMNVIAGLLQPQQGGIFIDGNDINTIDLDSYRRKIGYITQEPVIFDDDIYNNVTFWDEKTPDTVARMWKALEMANLKAFVEQLNDREESRLGNNGINLSGGQRQRVAIARELYKDVDILFMDEATSSLDSETERIIQENIDMLKGKLTIVIIAHRLSTIKGVDRVAVLKAGKMESIGSYQQVVQESESFKKMAELQNLTLFT